MARIARLEARLEALEDRAGVNRPSVDGDRLLGAIAGAGHGGVFSASDVVVAATQDALLGDVLQGADARQVGTWLRALHGRHEGVYRLERIGRDAGGALWSVYVNTDIQPIVSG